MLTHLQTAKIPGVQAKAQILKNNLVAFIAMINALPAPERDELKPWLFLLYKSGLWSQISHAGVNPPAPPS